MLWLHQNSISSLPDGSTLFKDQSALTVLSLYNNQLTSVRTTDFTTLPNLNELWLYGNPLSTPPAGAFASLSKLTLLSLHTCNMTWLTSGMFEGLTSLQTLTVSNNPIAGLDADVFSAAGMSQLTVLYITYTRIFGLPVGVFDNLPALQQLYLNNNIIFGLPRGIFDNLPNLQILYVVSKRSRDSLALHTAAHAPPSLTNSPMWHRYLNNNNIILFYKGVFDKLTKLTQLRLYSNKFKAPCVYGHDDEVTKFNLHYCTLVCMVDFLGTLKSCAGATGPELKLNNAGILKVAHNAFEGCGDDVTSM